MNKVELEILKKIKPTKKEQEFVENFVNKLLKISAKVSKPFYAYPLIVGSIAKETWLSEDHDIDLFIVFRKKVKREKLEEHGLLIGTTICEKLKGIYNIKYAEHPYVRVKVNSSREIGKTNQITKKLTNKIVSNSAWKGLAPYFEIDVVPCYETGRGEKIISAVDRSPHHTLYIKENLIGYRVDHARLLKYFCKQIDVYGADAKHNGLSGYLCELLIINYGTFENTLKQISKLNFGEYIDIENITDEEEAKRKFKDALITIDPVDKNRNVASPLSSQNFLRLKLGADRYLKTKKFPVKKKITKNRLIEKLKENRGTNFVGIKFKPPEIIIENLYPQIRKLAKRLAKYLEEKDFPVIRYFSWTDEIKNAFIIFELENGMLSKFKKQEGPLIFSKEVNNFLTKYLENGYKIYIEENKFFIDTKRKFLNVEIAIKNFLKENKKEIPERIAEKKIRFFDEKEIIEEVNKNKELNSYLVKKYFEV